MELHIPEIEELRNELMDIKIAISNIKTENAELAYEDSKMEVSYKGTDVLIKYKFKPDTLVRKHIAADFLRVRLNELDDFIDRGLLKPDGRKRFRMGDLMSLKEIID